MPKISKTITPEILERTNATLAAYVSSLENKNRILLYENAKLKKRLFLVEVISTVFIKNANDLVGFLKRLVKRKKNA